MVDPKRSGIVDDPRHAYYTIKNKLTNKYALLDRNLDGAYGHQWKPTPPMEHLIFDGIVFENTAETSTIVGVTMTSTVITIPPSLRPCITIAFWKYVAIRK